MINFLHAHLTYNALGVQYFSAALFSICLGLIVLISDPTGRAQRAFFLITLTGGAWLFFFSMVLCGRDEALSMFWLKLNYVFAVPFISFSVFLFSVQWTGEKTPRWLLYSLFGAGVAFSIDALFFCDRIWRIAPAPWGQFNHFRLETRMGRWFAVLFLSFFFGCMVAALFNFLFVLRRANTPQRKTQLRFFIGALFIGYLGSNDFFVGLGFNQFPTGHFSFALFNAIVAYSIVRHRFLEIDVFRRRFSLLFLIYGFITAALLPLLVLLVRQFIHHVEAPAVSAAIILFLLLVGIVSFGPIVYAALTRHSFWLRTTMTTGLAHELKSPIGAIQGTTELLIERMENPNTPQQTLRDYAHTIQRNAERLDTFVRNLLHLARIQEESPTIRRDSFCLNDVVTDCVALHNPTAISQNTDIRITAEKKFHISGDREKMEQTISNILSNAVKYSDGGTIHIHLTLVDKNILCRISDKGRGIPPNELKHIFDRFYQGANAHKGAGIGLAIAKAWVEAHGGKIWAESEGEGKGTTVAFTMPI